MALNTSTAKTGKTKALPWVAVASNPSANRGNSASEALASFGHDPVCRTASSRACGQKTTTSISSGTDAPPAAPRPTRTAFPSLNPDAGQKGPAKPFTPINLWDVNLRAGGSAELPLPDGHTTTLLVLSGRVILNSERESGEGDLAILVLADHDNTAKVTANTKPLVRGGALIAEAIVGRRPFVMNSRAEIQQAFEDYQLGKHGRT